MLTLQRKQTEEAKKKVVELEVAQLKMSSRISLKLRDTGDHIVCVLQNPEYAFVNVLAGPNHLLDRLGSAIHIVGSAASKSYWTAGRLIQGQGLVLRNQQRDTKTFPAIEHLWVNGRQIF